MRRTLVILLLLLALGLALALVGGIRKSRLFSFNPHFATAPLPRTAPTASEFGVTTSTTQLVETSASAVLIGPRYTGRDILGRLWSLTAASARQSGTVSTSIITLVSVTGVYEEPSRTTPVTLAAQQGVYDQDTRNVTLKNNVILTGEGYTLRTPAVQASLESRTAAGENGVTLTGPLGPYTATATGNTFTVDQPAGLATLSGQVHVVLLPSNPSKQP